jgi:hypothetical protein
MSLYLPTEPNTVLSIARRDLPRFDFAAVFVPSAVRATATPDEAPRPPWGSVSSGIGGAAGWPFGEVRLAATPPTSDRCGAEDPLSGATCTLPSGHGDRHKDVDDDFEITWPQA